jgi:CubicO group peptidase (beta-lactamase class C family)
LIQREVFDPLGMQSAGFGAPGTRADLDQPWGHADDGRRPVPPGPRADNPPAIGPAATVHASLRDWARFVGVHLAGARGEGSYLAPETFRKLHTAPVGQDYALDWGLSRYNWAAGRVLSHRGSNTMWMALVRIAPERGFAVLATTNQAGPRGSEAVDDAARAMIQHQLERSPER